MNAVWRHLSLGRRRASGQAMVEFAVVVPVFMLLLLGMLEFGNAFSHNITLEYATREGARTGSALGNGGGTLGCNTGQSPNAAYVDPQIIASVQRVLTNPVDVASISEIRIYDADANGNQIGTSFNTWLPGSSSQWLTPTLSVTLQFHPGATNWAACSRDNGSTPDSIGVSLTYTYHFITPLGNLMHVAGPPTFAMADRTVMALNPTN